jgi:hypothetical protein
MYRLMLRYTPPPPKLKKGHDRLFSLITNYVNLISRPALIWIQSRIRDRGGPSSIQGYSDEYPIFLAKHFVYIVCL